MCTNFLAVFCRSKKIRALATGKARYSTVPDGFTDVWAYAVDVSLPGAREDLLQRLHDPAPRRRDPVALK